MAKLIYNKNDMCFECSECGGTYSIDEVMRLSDYNTNDIEEFKQVASGYCMDCGCLWECEEE